MGIIFHVATSRRLHQKPRDKHIRVQRQKLHQVRTGFKIQKKWTPLVGGSAILHGAALQAEFANSVAAREIWFSDVPQSRCYLRLQIRIQISLIALRYSIQCRASGVGAHNCKIRQDKYFDSIHNISNPERTGECITADTACDFCGPTRDEMNLKDRDAYDTYIGSGCRSARGTLCIHSYGRASRNVAVGVSSRHSAADRAGPPHRLTLLRIPPNRPDSATRIRRDRCRRWRWRQNAGVEDPFDALHGTAGEWSADSKARRDSERLGGVGQREQHAEYFGARDSEQDSDMKGRFREESFTYSIRKYTPVHEGYELSVKE
ncbi:hypothetical protein C8R43DRAFT_961291 [Mycena crocata]|nr:hypothetical protein C8R43DRAFT_961291 [Mycena crocata]